MTMDPRNEILDIQASVWLTAEAARFWISRLGFELETTALHRQTTGTPSASIVTIPMWQKEKGPLESMPRQTRPIHCEA